MASILSPALTTPPSGVSVSILATTGIPTDFVPPPYPAIFSMLPLEGTFKWSLSWEGHPSGSFEFRTYASLKETVIRLLAAGTEFNAWGVGFRTGNPSIEEIPVTQQPRRMIRVSVPLSGRHENYVDTIVPLRQINTPGLDSIPDCLGSITEAQRASIGLLQSTTVAELAILAGDRFSGPSMPVVIPLGAPSTEGTTFISKAQERVRQHGCFLRFSEPNAVRALALHSVPTWTFQEPQIRSAISCTISGNKKQPFLGGGFHPNALGTSIPSAAVPPPLPVFTSENQSIYPYVHLYEPSFKLEGSFVEYLSLSTQVRNAPIITRPQWQYRQPSIQVVPEGDENPHLPPPNTGLLKDLSNLFSASGVTKTYKITTFQDGLPMSESLEKWGFAYLGADMYQTQNGVKVLVGAANKWRMIEAKSTTYHYDPMFGYQLGSTTIGWELVRYKEESLSDSENTITLNPGDPTNNFQQQRKYQLYEYFRNPYRREERNYLENLYNYYSDTELPPAPSLCKALMPSGIYELQAVMDPTWADPYFSSLNAFLENNFARIADPQDPLVDSATGFEVPRPPVITGKDSFHRTSLTINPSKNRRLTQVDQSAEDSFNTYESQFSSSDASYSNSLENTSFKRDSGRPGVHTRLASLYVLREPENQVGIPRQRKVRHNYLARTNLGGVYNPTSLLQGGSLNYSAAKTLAQAQTAAKTEININNIRDCLQESFTIPFSPQIREGDRLTYVCNGETRQRRVLSISHEVEIKGSVNGTPIVKSKGSQVSVGLERETPVTFTTELIPIPMLSSTYVPSTTPLGEVLNPSLLTRRNF